MEHQTDSWVTETQSTLRGITTASLKGEHSRLRRAKERENWYNTGVSIDGKLIKSFKFVDQQALKCQKNSKLLSSIRSHVKQDSYRKQQATSAILGHKRKNVQHLHAMPKMYPTRQFREEKKEGIFEFLKDEASSEASQRHRVQNGRSYLSAVGPRAIQLSASWLNNPFNTFGGYDPLNRPRALFLLNHCENALHVIRDVNLTTFYQIETKPARHGILKLLKQ